MRVELTYTGLQPDSYPFGALTRILPLLNLSNISDIDVAIN